MTVRGTGRGRRLGLTREKVIAAAVTMIDRDGPDSFSLRKLAAELDIENMSLYSHVPNKDALLDGVAEVLLARIEFPRTDSDPDTGSGSDNGTWQDRIRAHATAFRAAAKRHPKAFPLVLTRPTQSPAALEAIGSTLATITELGLSPEEMVHVLRSYTAFIVGTLMRELGYALHLGTTDPDEIQQRVDAITSTGAPLLADVAPYLATSDHDAEFHYGLELLIAGLAARTGVPYDGGPPNPRPQTGLGGDRAEPAS
ncbi:transcriptional regulator, TetR family [Streptomyces sp. L-9-10]|uniref:TetR/AcrR family transcriptional regulator C-terminal domain-containing protein n=1 Tax=Streptomyces sp. L-9-10 TaxID=1478131 RepID=UPI00101C5999|nr:TetR/AcrR family transcriptional regulator C-terminal domain-containing protein [Streptomyces sp. L-9-10]RYJ32003.1 transcriptional regulator, TetR family [Streptomyces sp. L-9-10]